MMFAHLLKGILVTLSIVGASLALPDATRAQEAEPEAAESDFCDTDFNQPAEEIIAQIGEIQPMALICAVRQMWERGDRVQAVFWMRIWIIRTQPWVSSNWEFDVVRDVMVGPLLHEMGDWAGSDIEAYVAILDRAHAYEQRLPLSIQKPENMTKSQWTAAVMTTRAGLQADHMATLPRGEIDSIKRQRLEAGQYVGPFKDPGAPLPDDWR